ncbi:MAG: NAD-dependent protein deacylase [Eggerthellaceae bacterium]|nr:NAD-dependent protein deacylase [Eggerthellaceae bacterium]
MNTTTQHNIETLRTWIQSCPANGLVFFGGAGVSTESGIPDFRSADGLYAQKYHILPEQIVSHSYFMEHTKLFYEFYFDKMIFPHAQPNACHTKLAQLEHDGVLQSVITQNIDGLHQQAGSTHVHELHGSVHRNTCLNCKQTYTLKQTHEQWVHSGDGIPHCTQCGGIIKPDVVLYEEPLDDATTFAAVKAIASAELLIIGGTSLAVYPAAGMIDYFSGKHLAIVNMSSTPRDEQADLCINAPIGEVFNF